MRASVTHSAIELIVLAEEEFWWLSPGDEYSGGGYCRCI